MTALVLPIAGQSSRFNLGKPKWALRAKTGKLMVIESILGISSHFERIIFIPLQEHVDRYGREFAEIRNEVHNLGFDFEISPIDSSVSQPDTVFKGLTHTESWFMLDGGFMIKDCDNFWRFPNDIQELRGNFVVYANVEDYPAMEAANKSYIEYDAMGKIHNIVEKKVISNHFCVGGYGFNSFGDYKKAYYNTKAADPGGEFHVSHVIYSGMLHSEQQYTAVPCCYFQDWGTQQDWEKANGR